MAGNLLDVASATSLSSGGSGLTGDGTLEVYDTDGTTLLESDNDDGAFAATAPSIAGLVLPTTGTIFIKMRHSSAVPASEIDPYDLYVKVQSGAPATESEPNNNAARRSAAGERLGSSGTIDPPARRSTTTRSRCRSTPGTRSSSASTRTPSATRPRSTHGSGSVSSTAPSSSSTVALPSRRTPRHSSSPSETRAHTSSTSTPLSPAPAHRDLPAQRERLPEGDGTGRTRRTRARTSRRRSRSPRGPRHLDAHGAREPEDSGT